MPNFENVTIEDLEKELERRKSKADKPQQLEDLDINMTMIRLVCQEYIDDLNEKGYVDEDMSHYIFEAAMEMVFGDNIWDWVNKRS